MGPWLLPPRARRRQRLVLPAATWALVQRAMEGARRRSGSSLSDAQALEAVARDALARQAESAPSVTVTPRGHDQGCDPDEQGGTPSATPRGHGQGRDEAPLRSDPESETALADGGWRRVAPGPALPGEVDSLPPGAAEGEPLGGW